MRDRIQKVLDGELPREALGPSERAELEAWEDAGEDALAGLRSEPVPDVSAAVMARIARLPGHNRPERTPAWRRGLAWLWSPRPVALRPAWALAAAAIVAVLLVGGPWRGPEAPAPAFEGPGVMAADGEDRVFVHFRLDAANARTVQLAADFTDWAPVYGLNETAPGVWTVVVAVDPGVHQYAFVVDGERWVPDPLAPKVDDGFGGSNSRLDVVTPEPRRTL